MYEREPRLATDAPPQAQVETPAVVCSREAGRADRDRFLKAGFHQRHVFPHRLYLLHRGGSDGLSRAERMCQVHDPGRLRQLLLFATPDVLGDLPRDLFFDEDVIWHGQQLGMPGLIATANLVLEGRIVTVTQMLSDLVQRISRRREHKTRVENRFKGWAHLLVNGILDYASDLAAESVRFPTSTLIMRNTDPTRTVDPTLFQRTYDHAVRARTAGRQEDGWWWVKPAGQSHRCVHLRRRIEPAEPGKVVCVSHDIEHGLGHRDEDPLFAKACEIPARGALERMLAAETQAGIRATYNVVGQLWDEVAEPVRSAGASLGFHSYCHVVPGPPRLLERLRVRLGIGQRYALRASTRTPEFMELARCREIDYRLRGYRPPQSRITMGLHDRHLAYRNFEWLASSARSLGSSDPRLENGIVKIPVLIDDYDLYRGKRYDEWERSVLDLAEGRDFVSISLHDCYAQFWIDRYPALLARLADLGVSKTFDDVADTVLLASTRWL